MCILSPMRFNCLSNWPMFHSPMPRESYSSKNCVVAVSALCALTRLWPNSSKMGHHLTKSRCHRYRCRKELFLTDLKGVSMLKQAVSRRRLSPAGSLRGRQRDLAILEPISAASSIVAFFSHDLRLPLTAILANAEFLTRSDISEMEKSDLYQEIRGAIDRMNEMVSSLLECSKGRDTLRPA